MLHNTIVGFVILGLPTTFFFFFFNDTATTEIYTLSLHDAFRSRFLRHLGWLPSAGTSRRFFRRLLSRFIKARLKFCGRSEEHTSELQSQSNLVCRLLLEKKKTDNYICSLARGRHLLENITPLII